MRQSGSGGGSASVFKRLKDHEYQDGEEVRYDVPATLGSNYMYHALNVAGTATSAASWSIIRTSFDANGNPDREQFRTGISWDNRAVGWP